MVMAACGPYESCILADLLYKVPVLVSFLPPESFAKVLACNRELRHYMHQLIWKVTMANEKGIQLLSKHSWSQLSVVLMPEDRCAYNLAWPKHSKLELLAFICFSQHGWKSTAFLVKAQQATPVPQQGVLSLCGVFWHHIGGLCAATYFYWISVFCWALYLFLLMTAPGICLFLNTDIVINKPGLSKKKRWLLLYHALKLAWHKRERSMSFKTVELPFEHLPPIAHFLATRSNYTFTITRLSMSNTKLGDANIAQLLKGTFAVLIALDLSGNSLGLCTMRALGQSSFPVLKHLCLTDASIDKLKLEQLLTAPWPQLQSLNLSCNPFGNDAVVHFAPGKLTALMSLNLSGTCLTGIHGLGTLMHNQGLGWQF